MSNYEHTTKFKADISSLKSGITQANLELKKIASEYKATASAAELSGKKQEQLQAKLDYLNKTLEQQNTKLKNYKDQLKTTQSYTDQLAQKEKELTAKLESVKNKFGENSEEVKKYKQELTNVQKEIASNHDKMEKLNTTINNQQSICNKTAKELENLGNEAKDMGYRISASGEDIKGLGINLDGIEGAITAASTALNGLDDIVNGLLGTFQDFAVNGIKWVIDGLKELTENTFDVGMTFEKEMSLVEAHFGNNLTNGMDEVIAKAEELGANTSKTATEVAESFDVLAKAGFTSKDAIAIMDSIVDLSLGTQEDLTTMTNTLKNAILKFNLDSSVETATHVADLLAQASTNADTDVSALGEALSTCGGMAASLGYSLEDTVLALDMLAKYSLNGSEAGTALKRILLNLVSPNEKLDASIEKYGYSLFDATGNAKELSEVLFTLRDVINDPALTTEDKMSMESLIGGARGIEALSNLVNLSEQDFVHLQEAIYDCDGASKEMAKTAQDNVSGSLDILESAIDGVYLALFGKLGEPARNIIDTLANSFSYLVESIKTGNLAPYVQMVADALESVGGQLPQLIEKYGPDLEKLVQNFCVFLSDLIKLLPSLVESTLPKIIDLLNNLMEKAPGFIEQYAPMAIDLIAFLVENLPEIFEFLLAIKAAIVALKTVLAGLGIAVLIKKLGVFAKIGASIVKFGGWIASAAKFIIGFFTGPVGIVITIISAIIGLLVLLYNKCEGFRNFVDGLVQDIVTFWKNLPKMIEEFTIFMILNLAQLIVDIVKRAKEIWQNILNFIQGIKDLIKEFTTFMILNLVQLIVDIVNRAKELKQNIINFFVSIYDKAIEFGTYMILNLLQFFSEVKARYEELKQNIYNFFKSIYDKVVEFIQNVISGISDFLKSIFDKCKEIKDNIVNKWNEIIEFFKNINLWDIGANIIQGLIDGIQSKWQSLKNTIGNWGQGIKDGFTSAFDIHSPSRWMRDFFAGNLMEGFEIGIDKNTDSVLSRLNNLNNKIKGSFDFSGVYGASAALSGGYGSYSNSSITNNDNTVSYNPTFNYNKPLNSREIYRQNKNMLSNVLNRK